jgi:hypothetical protein
LIIKTAELSLVRTISKNPIKLSVLIVLKTRIMDNFFQNFEAFECPMPDDISVMIRNMRQMGLISSHITSSYDEWIVRINNGSTSLVYEIVLGQGPTLILRTPMYTNTIIGPSKNQLYDSICVVFDSN